MPSKPIAFIAAAAVVIVFSVAVIFVVDVSRADLVANGVRVGGVDIGELRADAARLRLRERLLKPLSHPLVVRAGGRSFHLSAREAGIHANIDAMVDQAIERGRSGSILARSWRAVSGAEVNANLPADIDYSRPAVRRLVDRVRVSVSREPVDAKVDFGPQTISISPSRTGRTIDARRLRTNVANALTSDVGDRTVTAPIERLQPKVSKDELAKRYPVVVTIDRGNFRLNLFKQLKRAQAYPIAVGQAGLETPAGLYTIQNKAVNPAWHVPNSDWAGSLAGQVIPGGAPNNPIRARWLGVYDGVGVHGTDARGSIGTNASHGCIRMLIEDVEKLYDAVPVGTPIYIG
jgi:lipoprotein-anchoring transpeptidase ErfK/SrfK